MVNQEVNHPIKTESRFFYGYVVVVAALLIILSKSVKISAIAKYFIFSSLLSVLVFVMLPTSEHQSYCEISGQEDSLIKNYNKNKYTRK